MNDAGLVVVLLILFTGDGMGGDAGKVAGPDRETKVVREFRKSVPCPSTGHTDGACPGYVVDHPVPLCWGGPDAITNMAWQEQRLSYMKDVFEREACAMKKKMEAEQKK